MYKRNHRVCERTCVLTSFRYDVTSRGQLFAHIYIYIDALAYVYICSKQPRPHSFDKTLQHKSSKKSMRLLRFELAEISRRMGAAKRCARARIRIVSRCFDQGSLCLPKGLYCGLDVPLEVMI